ncbi:Serine carboxypeptidase-like 18 [Acorus calamus]|uniref:Serine carboxypeptidase-like 18 n=1 Tax=Acorus calamus TaxID=4465 RepID=A0AAV9C0K8_ACOCL|nr:Serine carboxypeptidase-like 18 [Acorus calamus]
MGLISKELYKSAKKSCAGQYAKPNNSQCVHDVAAINKCISGLSKNHILEPKCEMVSPHPRQRRSLVDQSLELVSPPSIPDIKCHRSYGFLLSYYWANNDTVREALHVQRDTVEEWVRCDFAVPYVKDVPSSIPYHHILTTRGYRALVYSGDHDLSVNHVGTQAWIKSLNFPIVDDWRPWSVDGQVAGYTRSFANNLTFALVKGGGHTSPEDRPKECYNMFERWIAHKPL